ncbi:SDH family Clp fold serine proteinase [Variovorax sp. PMC12]|uniref:SDH family Clp fold serine proteinase n=1 Tax=Variovorax sp. PMC12 TaxID=2126319 RepID=UPI000D116D3E|nr:SppA protein [Variovorax sp. PMC12]
MNLSEISAYYKDSETDVFGYVGRIEKSGYDRVCDAIEARGTKRKKSILFLCTGGGNPNTGYRIARAFTHHYGSENFTVAIPAECKSAGTLVCIGASRLIMFDKGELGPLDVQFQKKDEIFQQTSGLDILRGMTYLKSDALATFNQYLLDINSSSGLSTKVASELAGDLVRGIYEPMYAQIDPVRLGEMNAALQIAHEYGTRLNDKSKNLKPDALGKLINNYPAHGFVIDRAEARTLFERVERNDHPAMLEMRDFVVNAMWRGGRQNDPYVLDLVAFIEAIAPKESPDAQPETAGAIQPEAAHSNTAEPQGAGGQPPSGDGEEQPLS